MARCESACNKDPVLEWALWGGQSGELELTLGPGFRRMEAQGQIAHAQHRIQAPGRSGVPGRRDASRAGQTTRHLPEPDPGLGSEVRGRRLRRGRPGRCRSAPAIRSPDRGARASRRQAGIGARVSKGDCERRTAAEKRDYVRHCRPPGLSIAEGCRLMGIAARPSTINRPRRPTLQSSRRSRRSARNSNSMAGGAFAPSCGIEA